MRIFYLLALLLQTASWVRAHDLYLMPDRFRVAPGERLGIALHNGDSFPGSEKSVALDRIRDAKLHSKAASAVVESLRVEAKRTVGSVAVPGSGTLLLTVSTIPTLIELDRTKFESYLKEEGLTEVVEWRKEHGESAKPGRERYSKYAKSLVLSSAPDGGYNLRTDFPIEIVPEKDPYLLKRGDALPVRVYFRNAPAAGLQLEAAWTSQKGTQVRPIGRTDAEGRISVPIASNGKWRLHAIKMERCADPKAADWESFWASLTFEVR